MEKLTANFTRKLYILPGGYFLVHGLRKFFQRKFVDAEWRTFSFRGVKFKVDISKQMGNTIFWRGAHDWAPIFALEKLINRGDTIIDIGANQGEYALWAARKAGSSGQVHAYEPLTSIFNQLKENIHLNPELRISPHQTGLSDQPGRLKLYSNDNHNEGVNTLFPDPAHTSKVLEEIELNTLDLEVEKLGLKKIDLIKIDVEGAELMVLKGGKATIDKHRPILFLEFNEKAFLTAGYSSADILSFLEKYGYQFYKIGLRGKLTLLAKDQVPEFCNIMCKV